MHIQELLPVLTGRINLHKFYVRYAACDKFRKGRVQKFSIRSDVRDSTGDESSLSRRKFNILIPRSQETLNATIVCFVHVIDHNERSVHGREENNRGGVLRKYLWSGIERLNYFQDRRRNIGENISAGNLDRICTFIKISLSLCLDLIRIQCEIRTTATFEDYRALFCGYVFFFFNLLRAPFF